MTADEAWKFLADGVASREMCEREGEVEVLGKMDFAIEEQMRGTAGHVLVGGAVFVVIVEGGAAGRESYS